MVYAPSLSVPANSYNGSYGVSWTSVATATSYVLQEQTNGLNSASPWVDVPGTTTITGTNMPIIPSQPRVFFRLRHP